ncbi:Crp/Fnr family transcriptional regulator [Azospirillum doebereinerae]|uniref:Crp/Fnr family transcriptional regulator n=1 Tax=Azospirillum doebereinerae TaxID=92933 RepID=UPI001EE5B93E|nr:Crp/Fnr family transcriptional regulator [Azospirillum doebereinerae]MCG5243905.1 Crp/Fnr family transcriptional regulator [Azospirillum doebereinerae]
MEKGTTPITRESGALHVTAFLRRDSSGNVLRSPCELCTARDYSVCRHITGKDFEQLFPHGPHVQIRKAGTTIFLQGEPFGSVFIVQNGWLLVHKLFEDGRRQIIRFVLPGDLIGFEGNEVEGMSYSAEAITDVALCGIRYSLFFKTCAASPQLAMNFATTVTREALAAWNHVGALGQQRAQGRVANLLLDLHHRVVARCGTEPAAIQLPINQIHIASATGLTSVHVCRTLKQMRQVGLLEFRKGQLVLLDTERLAEIAQLDPAVPLDGLQKMN